MSAKTTKDLDALLSLFKFLSEPFKCEGGDTTNPDHSTKINLDRTKTLSPQGVLLEITRHCRSQLEFLESSKPLLQHETHDCEDSLAQGEDASWSLTCIILALLTELKISLEEVEANQTEQEKPIETLSIQSQINVQKSVELAIGFGVVPYLLPGVGVPGNLRRTDTRVSLFLLDVNEVPPYKKYLRLSHSIEVLLTCCRNPGLSGLIIGKYTSDILAGLLQICRAPIACPNATDAQPRKNGALSEEQYNNVMKIRETLKDQMTNMFLLIVPKSTLISSLFLIGASERPRWFSGSCNDLLCNILFSQNGLVSVSTTMIESSGPSETWKLMRVVSGLMKNALTKSGNPTCHEKLRSLSEQCLSMIGKGISEDDFSKSDHKHGKQRSENLECSENENLKKIGLFCGLTLMDIDFEFAKSVFWNKLFYHALMLDMRQAKVEKNTTHETSTSSTTTSHRNYSSSARKISVCVSYVECLLCFVKPMSISLPLRLLQPLWSLFLQIFVACGRYLKKPVQEPNVAAAAEHLYHKLKDVLIMLFEIYSSGSGQNLVLPTSTGSTAATFTSESSKEKNVKSSENFDLCDFTIMLLLNQDCHGVPVLSTFDLREIGESGQMQVVSVHQEVISPSSNYKNVYEEYLDFSSLFLCAEILKDSKLKAVWPHLFRQLLTWGTKKHGSGNSNTLELRKIKQFRSDKMPTKLCSEGSITVDLADCHRFIIFRLLGELGDEESVLEQFAKAECIEDTLYFIELLLNKFTEEACMNSENVLDTSQLVTYTLGIIGALVEAASMTNFDYLQSSQLNSTSGSTDKKEISDTWHCLKTFIPHLRKLSQCTQPSFLRVGIPEMASNLVVIIATNGAAGHTNKTNQDNVFHSRFQLAIEDASSSMAHVKGHGILELRRLIEGKDQETLQNEHQVLRIFQDNLGSEDSYVYLMSIQGLASLALKFHKTIVPVLIKEFDFTCSYEEASENKKRELKSKYSSYTFL